MSARDARIGTADDQPPALLQQLANPVRWRVVRELAKSDLRVNELIERVGGSGNLISYHLRHLREAGIVVDRHSSADARDVYYALELDGIREALLGLAGALHPGLVPPSSADGALGANGARPRRLLRVLFLCTHNSARSQMAEVILRALAGDGVEVHSAGSEPTRPHPLALRALRDAGLPTEGLRSKDMSEFETQHFDHVISLCDRVREDCSVMPGDPERAHWSLPDPAATRGPEDQVYKVFQRTRAEITTRARYLVATLHAAPGGR